MIKCCPTTIRSISFRHCRVADVSRKCLLTTNSIDVEREQADLLTSAPGAGAVASFAGLVRPRSSDEANEVDAIYLDHHPTLTLRSMQDVANSALSRFAVGTLHIVHRCGPVAAGEPIVFVGAAAAHRRAAFDAVDYVMDRLKTDAVFWKREDRADGSEWIEPTDADRAAHRRWKDENGGD